MEYINDDDNENLNEVQLLIQDEKLTISEIREVCEKAIESYYQAKKSDRVTFDRIARYIDLIDIVMNDEIDCLDRSLEEYNAIHNFQNDEPNN